ncbi:hypothetical protein GCM10014715_89490 [Streptomyces spiralis]|uniref:OAA-family lectin sugar binding domain-containing protein n=1 Tax=Streptomyces spiralis TaxID=66376 RepID=A0A919E7E7_9ACTN|nr:hypothetical protein [Streptomyces spiralis]GHF21474.1 hypothetical protein GCM10014715_89490 [Streptomyces spiralis]
MEPTFADFSTKPARLSNVVVGHHRCGVASSHLALGGAGWIKLDFTVDGQEEVAGAVVKVSTLDPAVPMDVVVNGKALAEPVVTGAAGTSGPQDVLLTVPGEVLTVGDNLLEIRNAGSGEGLLRLRAVTVNPEHDKNRSERDMAVRAATRSVFAFSTERRVPGAGPGGWQPGPRLLFHIHRGGQAVPTQLSWRGVDGSEAVIGLREDLSGFRGTGGPPTARRPSTAARSRSAGPTPKALRALRTISSPPRRSGTAIGLLQENCMCCSTRAGCPSAA